MTFSMKDGSSSDNYPDKSSRRVRHGKGGCTSKRKKGGCVARTPVSTSPAARLLCTARCTLSSSTLHALSFGEVTPQALRCFPGRAFDKMLHHEESA